MYENFRVLNSLRPIPSIRKMDVENSQKLFFSVVIIYLIFTHILHSSQSNSSIDYLNFNMRHERNVSKLISNFEKWFISLVVRCVYVDFRI